MVSTAGLGAAALQSLGPVQPKPVRAAVLQEDVKAEVQKPEPAKISAQVMDAARPAPEIKPPQAAAGSAISRRVASPDATLLEPAPHEQTTRLPRVAPDGRSPRVVYAAAPPMVPAGAARIALIVSGVGLSEKDTQAAISGLPGPVSLAISAYASMKPAMLEAARAAGHELFASIPMEPHGYPQNDEGPQALLTGSSPERNAINLEWALGRIEGAVGATGASDGMLGERFAEAGGAMDPVLDEIARRGLLYLDPRPGRGRIRPDLRAPNVDVVIDDPPARAEMEAKLATLERVAREKGMAVGLVGRLQPVTLDRLSKWTKALAGRGFVLVPISSLVPDSSPVSNAIASQ